MRCLDDRQLHRTVTYNCAILLAPRLGDAVASKREAAWNAEPSMAKSPTNPCAGGKRPAQEVKHRLIRKVISIELPEEEELCPRRGSGRQPTPATAQPRLPRGDHDLSSRQGN